MCPALVLVLPGTTVWGGGGGGYHICDYGCVYCVCTDEWEEMCVVAVSDRVAKAMETKPFQQLLGALGLQPPSEQV